VRVTGDAHVARLATDSGPATTTALMSAATEAGVKVLSLAVQSTTLDDVFVHYTGRQLRDAIQQPSAAERLPMIGRR
jgi:ABC-2 type transport system ATP-binding protein